MSEGRKRLTRAVKGAFDAKKDKPRLYKGLMGAYVDGVQTVEVTDRADFVWVRLRGATGEVIQAFNDNVAEVFDLPVLVIRDERFPHIWRIEGRDLGQYGSWGGASYIPPHGRTHSFTASGADTGSDPVWVFKRQFMPFMPRPNASGTNTIYLEAEYYFWEGRYRYWPGSGTDDLLQFRPTGGGGGRFVTIFMRGDEGIPDYLVGPEFSLIYPPSDPTDFIAVPDQDVGIPIAAVSLQTGTQQIGWQEIYDLRLAPSELPSTGSNLQVWDEGVALGEVSRMNFVGPNVEAFVTGSFAWISVTGGAGGGISVLDDGVIIGTGIHVDFQKELSASISGTHVRIDVVNPTTGTVVLHNETTLLGSVSDLAAVGPGVVASITGTFGFIEVPTAGGGVEAIGVFGLDDGVPLGTGTWIDWGYGLDASISGTVLAPSLNTLENYIWGGDHQFSGSTTTLWNTVGIGTSDVPQGGIGWARVAIHGPPSSSDGPNVQFTVTGSDYPVMSFVNLAHDNLAILFDSYYEGGWRSSLQSSNFRIYKIADQLDFGMETGLAQGLGATFQSLLNLNENGVIVNVQAIAPFNFRVVGTAHSHLLFAQSSTNRVGVNTSAPAALLHVSGTFLANDLAGFGDDVTVTGTLSADSIGIGTHNVPHGGIGIGRFAMDGPAGSVLGPHVQWTAGDDYPVTQLWNWAHDNIALSFDAYIDSGAAERRSSAFGAFQIRKIADELQFRASDIGGSAGDAIGYAFPLILRRANAVFNEAGAHDIDVRMEGVTDPYNFFHDAGLDRIGIGTNAPAAKLHVTGTFFVQGTSDLYGIVDVFPPSGDAHVRIFRPNDIATDAMVLYDQQTAGGKAWEHGLLANDGAGDFYLRGWNNSQFIDHLIIGRTSGEFQVTGTFLMRGDLAGFAGDVHVTGSVFSGDGSFHTRGWLQTADRDTPATPPTGEGRWFSQSGSAYFVNDAGSIFNLAVGGGVGGLDHGSLVGLSDDDHSQYLLLAGRSGQIIYDDPTISGTFTAAEGVILGAGDATASPAGITVRGPDASGDSLDGVDVTFDASRGTGPKASGRFAFRTAPAGSAPPANFGAVTTDTQSSGQVVSFSKEVAGNNPLLVVALSHRASTALCAHFNDLPLTFVRSDLNGDRRTELWYLAAPPTGTYSVVVTGTADMQSMVAAAVTINDAAQSSPIAANAGNTGGTGTFPSTTIASDETQLILDVIAWYPAGGGNDATVDPSQVERWHANAPDLNVGGAGSTEDGEAGSTAMDWTLTNGVFDWAQSVIAINPAASIANVLTDRLIIESDYVAVSGTFLAASDLVGFAGDVHVTGTVHAQSFVPSGSFSIWSPDAAPPTGTATNDEFDDRSFDTGLWTEFDPGSSMVVTEQEYGLRLVQSTGAGNRVAGVYQSAPTGSNWSIMTRVALSAPQINYGLATLALWEDASVTTDGIYTFGVAYDAITGSYGLTLGEYTDWNSFNRTVLGQAFTGEQIHQYLRIRRDGTTYHFDYSSDGLAWMRIGSETLAFTPAHFGLSVENINTGEDIAGVYSFFRFLDHDMGLTNPLAGRRMLMG